MHRHRRTTLAVASCFLGAAVTHPLSASAQQAPAPTLSSRLPCFSPATGAQLTGEGWTPGGQVQLHGRYVSGGTGDALDIAVTADAKGRIRFRSSLPNDDAVTLGVEVTGSDVARLAAGAPVEQREARVRFKLTWFGPFYRRWNTNGPARGRPGRVSTIEASGYIGHTGEVLYAHYLRHRDDRFRTVRVGRLRGSCGGLKLRFREFAFRNVRAGTYSVFFDTIPVPSDITYDSPGYRRVVVTKAARRK